FPLAKIISVVVLLGLVTTSEKDKFPKERETLLLICLIGWFTITTLYALAPEDAWEKWDLTIKVFLMTFVILFLFQDRTKLKHLITTIALSIGYYGIGGGVFAIYSGGNYTVWGPPDSFISDNNALALAELIVIPLLICLYKEANNTWMKMLY